MAIDEVPAAKYSTQTGGSRFTGWIIAAFIGLALLAIGEIHSFSKIDSTRADLLNQQAQAQKQFDAQLSDKIMGLENSNAQALDILRAELDRTAHKMGASQRRGLAGSRAMLMRLEQQQAQNSNELRQELSQKADQQQVGTLTQSVSSTQTDLNSTKKTINTLASDLGMARSDMGTLIARNHQDIEALRKLGERDYYEFTLTRNKEQNVAGVGLVLKKTNVNHHLFNLNVIADDMTIAKKSRTINEPVFFSVSGSRSFYELVVNQVQSGTVKGYISTSKGAVQIALR